MQNSERQKFEDGWKSAFEGAEMTPSDNVWNAIELDLAGQESATMKKRVVFYQRLAAATVTFALLSGLYAFYIGSDQQNQIATKQNDQSPVNQSQKATTPNEATPQSSQESIASNPADNNVADRNAADRTSSDNHSSDVLTTRPLAQNLPANGTRTRSGNSTDRTNIVTNAADPGTAQPVTTDNLVAIAVPSDNGNESTPVKSTDADKGTTTAAGTQKNEQTTSTPEKVVTSPIIQTAPLVASLEPNDNNERRERKKSSESMWLALGGTAGSYSPNNAATAVNPSTQFAGAGFDMASTNASQQIKSNSARVGTSYSVGVAFGKRLGQRVVVQSGINLNKQQVDYTSNFDATLASSNTVKAALADYEMQNGTSVNRTNTYTVNSAMEVVSIPFQAGYLIIDRKFGWLMNAGVSSDFFLRNTLVDKSGQRESFTQAAGDNSPYRTVNWSGLVNTELSYKLGRNYRLSLVPGVRYSFNPLLKESGDSGRPLFLDLGFRFKYIFE